MELIDKIIDILSDNYQWLFSGVGVAIIGFVFSKYKNNGINIRQSANGDGNVVIGQQNIISKGGEK